MYAEAMHQRFSIQNSSCLAIALELTSRLTKNTINNLDVTSSDFSKHEKIVSRSSFNKVLIAITQFNNKRSFIFIIPSIALTLQ